MNLRRLEETVADLSSVQTCVAFWDAEIHKLYLCLSTVRNEGECSRLENDVASHLKLLPAIYKPDKIIIVEHFDFTTSGKICPASLRRVCRSSEGKVTGANDVDVLNAEEIFEKLWRQHVKSKDAAFVTSGGTSIAAIQISSAVADAFNMEFPELIGMLLRDVAFHECVNYVRGTLINRVSRDDVGRCVDVPLDNEIVLDAKKTAAPKASLLDSPVSTNLKNGQLWWYKCRGRTYGIRKERNTVKDISNIEILASYNLRKCVDASPTVHRYSE